MAPGCSSADSGDLHNLIFVDVDGVLNVGARDRSGGAPLLFSEKNLQRAQRRAQRCQRTKERETAETLINISKRRLGRGGDGTYAALATGSGPEQDGSERVVPVVPVLVERLARLVRAAGPRRTVVLSSSWRLPKHQAKAARLEQELSRHLGEDFAFDARTPLRDDGSAQERLRCIGEFIHGLGARPDDARLRVLVLDDFFATRLRRLSVGGMTVDSVEDAERYLLGRSQAADKVSVMVVQPFDEWVTSTGLRVQIGAGFAADDLCQAMHFVDADADLDWCAGKGPRQASKASTTADDLEPLSEEDEAPEEFVPPSQDAAPEEFVSPSQDSAAGSVDGAPEEPPAK